MSRYRLVWNPVRISHSRENPGRTHIVVEYSYGVDAGPLPRLLCARPLSKNYWDAERCRREGIDLPDEPSRDVWPTCDQCCARWTSILESKGETIEPRHVDWAKLWEESQGLRPAGQTEELRRSLDELLRGKSMFSNRKTAQTDAAWDIAVGEELSRREVHDRFGGSRQSGMTLVAGTDILLLFSSPSGRRYGYGFDGLKADGAYHYTGEGQLGDQKFTRMNAALRDHVVRGLRPRLFEEVRRSVVRYLGEVRVDPRLPWYAEQAKDRSGDLRKVIVFRLLGVDGQWRVPADPPPQTAGPVIRDIPIEARIAETFQMEPGREPIVAERREIDLVHRYAAWLREEGSEAIRKEIQLPGLSRKLYTDLFDVERAELLEAKSSASRDHVRLALGQLLDYARHVQHNSLAVLLPSDPGPDLLHLLHSVKIVCIFEVEDGKFVRCEP